VTDRGQAAVELALAVATLLLPVALVVTAFGPWSERRVLAESAAAEAARAAVLTLDLGAGTEVATQAVVGHGLDSDLGRLGWCGAEPTALDDPAGVCPLTRGSVVEATVEVWTPLVNTPWGAVGGLWVRASHAEPVDLYRSLP
jgi:hypothetical protein